MMEVNSFPSLGRRDFNASADPRIGSGRDNTTGGTTSHLTSSGTNSASLSALGSTFVPVLIYSVACFAIFFTLRRKCPRVYAPRTLPGLRTPEQPSPQLPTGWFNWIKPFFRIEDSYILNNCSLDGFFFLRYLRVLSIICFIGACVSWPILLPVNGTGGSGLTQLDLLTIGNIVVPVSFYAHVVVAWAFFGFILFTICRECIYYINLRQAYLLSPNYAKRLSSRTVLFTCVPKQYLEEAKLRKMFGDSAKNIWIVRNTNILRGLVEEREKTAERLEKAEIELIRMANLARAKHLKTHPPAAPPKLPSISLSESAQEDAEKGPANSEIRVVEQQLSIPHSARNSQNGEKPADPEYTHPYGFGSLLPDVRGSVAALWVPAEARPAHRPLANFGRRVDTIRWTRQRLKVLNREIWKLRRMYRGGDGTPLNAAFIEFDSQASAQEAFQILAHHQPLHMSPRFIGIRPEEIVWGSLRIRWWEHIMRRFFMMGTIFAAILFWSIPAAFVGLVSNISFLSSKVPFLSWIALLPTAITGVIQGLLPALALSWLMAAVPWMLRGCARVAGVPSHALVELFVQNAYFAFQVVQVFLITTITSTASAAFTDLLSDPLSAKDILAQNLPKASNFYLSYILVQCLAGGAAKLVNFSDIFRHEVLGRATTDPRKTFRRYTMLRRTHWGSVYPVFTNMGVIAISYSCIAPLILVFAGLGMYFMSYIYRYMLIYVYESDLDTKGLFYPRALMQLMTGLYIAEICLIGLFALKSAFGPMLLMILFLVFTWLIQTSLNEAITPLLYNLPRTLAMERDTGVRFEEPPAEEPGPNNPRPSYEGGLAGDYYNENEHFGDEPEPPPINEQLDADVQLRGVSFEGVSSFRATFGEWTKSMFKSKVKKESEESGLTKVLTQIKIMLTPDPALDPNFIMKWLHPEVYQDFRILQPTVNPGPDDNEIPEKYAQAAYFPPEMWRPAPRIWIPKDDARVSRQEVAHSKGVIQISDQHCWLDERCRVVFDVEESPLKEPRILY